MEMHFSPGAIAPAGEAARVAGAHSARGLVVGARRDERRHALMVPLQSRQHDRRLARLRSGVRASGKRVTAERRKGWSGAAAAAGGSGRWAAAVWERGSAADGKRHRSTHIRMDGEWSSTAKVSEENRGRREW